MTYASGSLNNSPELAYRCTNDRMASFCTDVQQYEQQLCKLMSHLQEMVSEADCLRRHYVEVMDEKMYLQTLLDQAEERLRDMDRIIDRYTVVKDAVVASDGFTYERETITQYLKICSSSGKAPQSQQTKEELGQLLIPNRSLKGLLDRLTERQQADRSADAESRVGAGGAHSAAGGFSSQPQAIPNGAEGTSLSKRNGNTDGKTTAWPIEGNEKTEELHPCLRVYGYCNYGDSCAYAKYPYDACLSNLKGKCRFRNQCHERHVEFRGPYGVAPTSAGMPSSPNSLPNEKPTVVTK